MSEDVEVDDGRRPHLVGNVLRAWGARRLTTTGADLRPLLVGAVTLCALLVVAVIHFHSVKLSPAWPPVGGDMVVPGHGLVPTLGLPAVQLALAVAAACLAAAARHASRVLQWGARIFLAFKGIDWGVEVLFSSLGLSAGPLARQQLGPARPAIIALSAIAVVAAVMVVALPLRVVRRHAWALPVVAALPFASYLVLYLTVGGRTVPVTGGISLGVGNVGFPAEPTVATWLSFWTMNQVGNLLWALVILTWWQVHEAARAARDVGHAVAPRSSGAISAVLLTLLVVKAALWAVSCGGGLGRFAGETTPVCRALAADGPGSIALAVVLVAGAALWLTRRRRRQATADSLVPAGMALIGALSLWQFLADNAIRVDQIVTKAIISPLGDERGGYVSALIGGDSASWSLLLVVVVALPVGAALLRSRWQPAGVLFLAFAAWNGARAVAVTIGLVQYDWVPWTLTMWSESLAERPGWMDPLTFDVAVTVAVAVAFAVLRRSPHHTPLFAGLVIVLVASTLVTHAGHFQPPLLDIRLVAAGALVFPIVYTLLFDAGWIVADDHRRVRVPGVLALSLLVLAVLVVSFDFSAGAVDSLAKEMLAVPVLVAVLLAQPAWSDSGGARRVDPEAAQDDVQQRFVEGAGCQEPGVHGDPAVPVDGEDVQH